jgi:hypothetical protein
MKYCGPTSSQCLVQNIIQKPGTSHNLLVIKRTRTNLMWCENSITLDWPKTQLHFLVPINNTHKPPTSHHLLLKHPSNLMQCKTQIVYIDQKIQGTLLTSSFDRNLKHPRTKTCTNIAKLTLGSLGLSIFNTVFNASMKTEYRTKMHIKCTEIVMRIICTSLVFMFKELTMK